MAGTDDIAESPWPVEAIPDADGVYMRIVHQHIENGLPTFAAFRNHGQGEDRGMSTDWSEYSTPAATRARSDKRPPADYGVVEMIVESVRQIPQQDVVHATESNNRAHTNVKGPKSRREGASDEIRLRFLQICHWVIEQQTSPA